MKIASNCIKVLAREEGEGAFENFYKRYKCFF